MQRASQDEANEKLHVNRCQWPPQSASEFTAQARALPALFRCIGGTDVAENRSISQKRPIKFAGNVRTDDHRFQPDSVVGEEDDVRQPMANVASRVMRQPADFKVALHIAYIHTEVDKEQDE